MSAFSPVPSPAPALALAAVLASLCAAGCASRGSLDAGYEQSLARWKDAPRATLLASWGAPTAERKTADGDVLIYVVHHDFGRARQQTVVPTVTAGPGGAHVETSGMDVAPSAPVDCTTRFVLKDDRVASWSFDGIGCGAPS